MIGVFYLQVMARTDQSLRNDILGFPLELETTSQEYIQDVDYIEMHNEAQGSGNCGINAFSCIYCSYVTNVKNSFKTHMMTHTGERPFACSICSYRSTQKVTLLNHMKRHTGEKPHSCQMCHFKTARKSSLKRHILMKHSLMEFN